MVDVMNTLQRTISSQERRVLAEGNRHTEHEQRNGSSHHKEDLNVKSLQQTVSMMRRTTEQIIDQFLLKLGTLITVEDDHNTADTKYSVYPVAKITVKSKDRRGSIRN